MGTIITKTGKCFACDYMVAIYDPDIAYIRILNSTLGDVAAIFSNAEETAILTYEGETLVGFTKLSFISFEGDAIKVALVR